MVQVSLFGGPSYLIEENRTVSAHAFLATNGVIPEGGLVVKVNAPNLSEFDLTGASVQGGKILEVRDGGFDLLMTEYTTLVNLPVAEDGETEVGETATFSVAAGDGYEINQEYSSNTFNLVDTEGDIPRGVVTEPNDIVSAVVIDTRLTPENPSFSAADAVYFDIGNRYLNEDGTYRYVASEEDVDLYQVELSAGDTVAVEISEVASNTPFFASALAAFDADGNRLIVNPGLLAAPDKLFGSRSNQFNDDGTVNESSNAGYLELTAPQKGVYYISVASSVNTPPVYEGDDYSFSIETIGLGDTNRVHFGNYEIEIDLLTPDNSRNAGTPTPPVSNPSVVNPPTLSLSASPSSVDSEGNFTNAVVEFVETGGISTVNFTIQTEGEIPEEGIEFVLNSNANLFDYISILQQTSLPSTIGGQSLGAFYNEDGIPTGIQLLIEEPTMTISLESANRLPFFVEDLELESLLYDQLEPLEIDGAEEISFFLQPGEGYEVAPDAGTTEVTYYDSVEDVPSSTSGDTVPEVGVTISESTLIESEGTETTFTFTLSEPPPAEGVVVYLDSEDEPAIGSVLGQFLVLEAEIEGGNFPVPNSNSSGLFFTITEQTATITASVFDELTVVDDVLTVQEGILDLTFALQPQAGYTIDEAASEVNLSILDTPDSQILVGLTASTEADPESTTIIESEGTLSVHTFSLSAAPPEGGLTVSVSTDSLADFDLDAIEVQGGNINNLSDDGFELTITEREATISLPVAADEIAEGSEIATFTLEPSDNYLIDQAATEAVFNLIDTPDQVAGASAEIEDNSTISQANALSLNADNPTVSINGAIAGFGLPYPERTAGFADDVDFYAVTLEADQTVTFDIDTGEPAVVEFGFTVFPELEDVPQQVDTELRLFDTDGNELASNNDGAAPDEKFSRDPFIEYTAETAGTYYIGVSQLGNRNYDPNVARSGSGWTFPEVGVLTSGLDEPARDYELTVSLAENITPPEEPTTEPIFGSLEADIIEVSGTSQLIFGGDSNDLIDASISSTGNNRIYAGSGDDTAILGMSDRIVGGEGADKFFATSGGDNILTGGAGADQFWIATAETPDSANIITDFTTGEDVLGIAGLGIGFDDLSITQQDDNVLIAANGSDLAILQGIGADSLVVDNFAFV